MHFHLEFIPLVLLNPLLYISILIFITLIIFSIAGKFGREKVLFEPFSLILFLIVVGSANLIYASLYNSDFDINYLLPLYFTVLSAIFYRIGTVTKGTYIEKNRIEFKVLVTESSQVMRYLLHMIFYLYMVLTLYAYFKIGIPLFTKDALPHHQFFRDLGFINRLFPGLQFILSALIIYNLMIAYINKLKKREYIIPLLMLFFLLVTFIFSGTKSAILPLILSFGLSIFWFKKILVLPNKIYRLQYKIFFLAFLIFILLSILNFNEIMLGAIKAMIAILFRGDTEVLFFPNMELLSERFSDTPSWTMIFGDPLSALRLISRDSLPISLSDQLHNYYYADIGNQVGGANMRLYFFSIVYFGVFFTSVIFIVISFFIGYLQQSTGIFQSNILGYLYFNIIYNTLCISINDPGLAVSFLFSIIFSLIIIYFFLAIYFMILKTQRLKKNR